MVLAAVVNRCRRRRLRLGLFLSGGDPGGGYDFGFVGGRPQRWLRRWVFFILEPAGGYDFGFLHIKAVDDTGHDRLVDLKASAVEGVPAVQG